MERDEFFTKLKALDNLNKMPNAWSRLEAITKAWPQDMERRTSSAGGNSSMFTLVNGRVEECQAKNVVYHTLSNNNFTLPSVVIYPYGITGLTADDVPVFENPETASMRAIVLEDSEQWRNVERHWLKRKAEPLFNIDESGGVFARFTDTPTTEELVLLDNILEQFESATSSR